MVTFNQSKSSNVLNDERFRPYLYTDYLPAEDTLELNSLLQRLGDQRRDTKRTIDVLSISLEALRRSYDDLDGAIYSYRSLLSPIRRLPDDVLGEIFLHTLPSTRNAIPVPSQFPLLLTLVCKKWRSIAERMPRLWSKLHVVLPFYQLHNDDKDIQRRSYVSAVKRWLDLSGSASLCLSISTCNGYVDYGSKNLVVEDLLLSIIQHSLRWREMDIICSSYGMQLINEKMGTSSAQLLAPSLQRLRVRYLTDPEDSIALHHYSAPSLKELSINLSAVSVNLSLVPAVSPLFARLRKTVNWPSLTRLSLHRHLGDCRTLFDILHQCVQLEALLLDLSESNPTQTMTSIYLPNLKSLALRGGNDNDNNYCGYFETPFLTDFVFCPTCATRGYSLDIDQPLLPRPSPLRNFLARCDKIQSLTISLATLIHEAHLVAIFETVPGITSLKLDYSNSSLNWVDTRWESPHRYVETQFHLKTFLLRGRDTTQYSTTQPPLLPNLQSFTLLCLLITPETAELILSFCKSRLSRPLLIDAADDTNLTPPFASLTYIEMTLSKKEDTIDIGADLARYAQSIGTRIGDDLILNITYPWGAEVEWVTEELLDPYQDLNSGTDRTWYDLDA